MTTTAMFTSTVRCNAVIETSDVKLKENIPEVSVKNVTK